MAIAQNPLVTVIDQDHLSVYFPGVIGTYFERIK